MPAEPVLIEPDWPAPPGVRACATTRLGGCSEGDWAGLNLGDLVGDDPARVAANRDLLGRHLGLAQPPTWLRQVHGTRVLRLPSGPDTLEADAAWCERPGPVCAIMTADCLPVLLSAVDGRCVGAAHAGWRGLVAGVLEQTVGAMPVAADRLQAWIGPAIGASAYEVGAEVREAFLADDDSTRDLFVATRPGHWRADLPGIARRRLLGLGLRSVHGGALCTHADPQRFYSYRRDGRTGRMASLIWMS